MNPRNLYVHIVLDRSGSMEPCRRETVSTLNEYLSSLKSDQEIEARISLSTFDSESIDLIRDKVPVVNCQPLDEADYQPRAMTPLFDAVGSAVTEMDRAEKRPQERMALVILTDGMENASHEYTAGAVKKLIERKQDEDHWLVLYLGADHDAWSQGAQIGLRAGNTAEFSKDHVFKTAKTLYGSSARYMKADIEMAQDASAFTDDERGEILGRDKS